MAKHQVTPYEEQLEKQVHELEALVAHLTTGEINPKGQCAYCGCWVRLLVRFNTNAEPIYLQCPECLGPHRMPEPITEYQR